MVLGGAGLVGTAVARRLALLNPHWRPRRIVVASLTEQQARETVSHLQAEQEERTQYIPHAAQQKPVEFVAEWGDVFVRSEFAYRSRQELLENPQTRHKLLSDLYDSLDDAYEQSHLVSLLRKHRPNLLIDSVNTATGLSYQNVFDAASRLRQALSSETDHTTIAAERLLLSQSVPTLTRHIQILSQVAQEYGMESYLKIGTTGTGGMGLNLPFTHSESKPSNLILAKNEAAFGHSGLLYLWSQTPGAPRVMEIKPAAAIGYRRVGVHSVRDRYGNEYIRKPRFMQLGDGTVLNVREIESNYRKLVKMVTVGVDMGENGLFTADEFRTLSAAGSMELITPEEIAEVCVQELLGIGTGHNVLASIRGSVLAPGYRAGLMRHAADECLNEVDARSVETTVPSIALGRLGPPLLTKILMEAHILKMKYGGTDGLQQLAKTDPVELSQELSVQVQEAAERNYVDSDLTGGTPTLTSLTYVASTIGVPVLLNDNIMLRGPNITVPEPIGYNSSFSLSSQAVIDSYAQSGWIDLRPSNLQVWKERACHILSEPPVTAHDTTVLTGLHYLSGSKELDAAALASWIIAGEVHGQRDLNSVSELE